MRNRAIAMPNSLRHAPHGDYHAQHDNPYLHGEESRPDLGVIHD